MSEEEILRQEEFKKEKMKSKIDLVEDIVVGFIAISMWLCMVIIAVIAFIAPVIGVFKGDYWSLLLILFWPIGLVIICFPFAIVHFDPKVFRQENYTEAMPDE